MYCGDCVSYDKRFSQILLGKLKMCLNQQAIIFLMIVITRQIAFVTHYFLFRPILFCRIEAIL